MCPSGFYCPNGLKVSCPDQQLSITGSSMVTNCSIPSPSVLLRIWGDGGEKYDVTDLSGGSDFIPILLIIGGVLMIFVGIYLILCCCNHRPDRYENQPLLYNTRSGWVSHLSKQRGNNNECDV